MTGLTQNVEELLKSDTARLMLANSEFLILLNQATTDRDELAALLNISDNQLSYITNVAAGHGLIRCSGNLVPFENSVSKKYEAVPLMTTKPGSDERWLIIDKTSFPAGGRLGRGAIIFYRRYAIERN